MLADRLGSVGTLAAGVAHEINNPLAFVTSNLDFAVEEIDRLLPAVDAETRTALDDIRAALREAAGGAARVAEIVREMEESAVVAYLPVTGSTRDILRSLRDELERLPEWGLPPVQSVEERILQQTEWAAAWQQYFPVQRIGRRVVIKPPWEHYQPQTGEVVVELDPGMAFGTGQHETTQMCIELLAELIQTGMAVVDVGTGANWDEAH